MLLGCKATPQEVKDDMSKYRDTYSYNSNSNFKFTYIGIEDLQKDVDIALSKEYGQFRISDKVNFCQPSEISLLSFKKINNFKNYEDAFSLFFSEAELSLQKVEKSSKKQKFKNETDKYYCCVREDSFIAALKPDAFDISFSYSEPIKKIYHPKRNDDLNDKYQLKNGVCSVADATKYINDWLEANYKPLFPEYDYQVNTVIVREHCNNYLYQFLIESVYNGVPLDSYTREEKLINDEITGKMGYIDCGIQIQMLSIDTIDSFTNLTGVFEPSVVENIDKCISLESALSYCENTFTDFKDVEISDIGIKYTIIPIYNTDKEIIIDDPDAKCIGYSSRPVWEFVIDVSPDEYLYEGQVNNKGDVRKYIYIDMITGECKYDFEIRFHGVD